MNNDTIKHLEMISAVISRMNSNSFQIKGWTIALASAGCAFAATTKSDASFVVVLVAIPFLWALDASFLARERRFRSMYDAIRVSDNTDFGMDAKRYRTPSGKWACAATSSSLVLFYGALIALIATAIASLPQTRLTNTSSATNSPRLNAVSHVEQTHLKIARAIAPLLAPTP